MSSKFKFNKNLINFIENFKSHNEFSKNLTKIEKIVNFQFSDENTHYFVFFIAFKKRTTLFLVFLSEKLFKFSFKL